jgi:prepilin-type N-terminal cleavage/methylation domain-containing protein
MKKTRGFTLIELLVVVAIIGVLSSVVLASLNSARGKGADAAIKSGMNNIKAQAEMLYDGCYKNSGSCTATAPLAFSSAVCPAANVAGDNVFTEAKMAAMIDNVKKSSAIVVCSSPVGGSAYAVVAQLKNNLSKAWCVDSTGKSKEVSLASNDQAGVILKVSGGTCLE